MLKALLMASVIIGAFLFQPSAYSQESGSNPCPFGGDLLNGMCTTSAPLKSGYDCVLVNEVIGSVSDITQCANLAQPLVEQDSLSCSDPAPEPVTGVTSINVGYAGWRFKYNFNCSASKWELYTREVRIQNYSESYQCPPDGSVGAAFTQGPYVTESGQNLCFYPAVTPDNDNECPPDTVGGCDEPPEEDEPNCFRGGANQLVCFEDPDEKCDSSLVNHEKVYTNCAEGCGFVNGNFLCSETPDLPSLDSCLVTTNGYACPSDTPPPNDDIPNPEKPLPDMTKQDFKDTNVGVETRLDATNKLLTDMMARNAENTEAINIGQGKSNAYLKQIDLNTKRAADSLDDIKGALEGDEFTLEEDTAQSILDGLGLTGDEKFSDLEKEVISLDSYRSQFTWSAGSSSCPPDRSMSLLGKSFLIDWQPYCDAFGVLGYFIEAAALLLSGFIAFGVRK